MYNLQNNCYCLVLFTLFRLRKNVQKTIEMSKCPMSKIDYFVNSLKIERKPLSKSWTFWTFGYRLLSYRPWSLPIILMKRNIKHNGSFIRSQGERMRNIDQWIDRNFSQYSIKSGKSKKKNIPWVTSNSPLFTKNYVTFSKKNPFISTTESHRKKVKTKKRLSEAIECTDIQNAISKLKKLLFSFLFFQSPL